MSPLGPCRGGGVAYLWSLGDGAPLPLLMTFFHLPWGIFHCPFGLQVFLGWLVLAQAICDWVSLLSQSEMLVGQLQTLVTFSNFV